MLLGEPKSAICVQRFDDSLNSAIHTTYRSWLRSSSMREPRDPPSKVVSLFSFFPSFLSQRHKLSKTTTKTWFAVTRKGAGRRQRRRRKTRGRKSLASLEPSSACHLTVARTDPQKVRPVRFTKYRLTLFVSVMILPQVHLRKPCYDFYFL